MIPDVDAIQTKAGHDAEVKDIEAALGILKAASDRCIAQEVDALKMTTGVLILCSATFEVLGRSGHLCMVHRAVKAYASMISLIYTYQVMFGITIPVKSSVDFMGMSPGEES